MKDGTREEDAVLSSQNEQLVIPKYGQLITVREKYRRRQRTHEKRGTWKYWDKTPFEAGNCIFLGIRILQNGIREYDSEYGCTFDAHERLKAALVSPGKNLNPIYVPLDSIEA